MTQVLCSVYNWGGENWVHWHPAVWWGEKDCYISLQWPSCSVKYMYNDIYMKKKRCGSMPRVNRIGSSVFIVLIITYISKIWTFSINSASTEIFWLRHNFFWLICHLDPMELDRANDQLCNMTQWKQHWDICDEHNTLIYWQFSCLFIFKLYFLKGRA